jgi:hypothetical protein
LLCCFHFHPRFQICHALSSRQPLWPCSKTPSVLRSVVRLRSGADCRGD